MALPWAIQRHSERILLFVLLRSVPDSASRVERASVDQEAHPEPQARNRP